jgi:hypothetical protein
MESAATSSQSIVEASVKLLKGHLENKWDRKNLPKGIEKRLSTARNSERSATERILLEHGGIATWLAYVRATHGKLHFKGQKSQIAGIARFEELSEDDRILVAQKVKVCQPHSSVTTIITKISACERRRK